jgi:hypothetical protein
MGGGGIGPIAGIFGGVLHLAGPAMALIIPLWLAATFATARTVFHSKVKRRTEELERLADRLAALTRELVPPSRPVLGAGVPRP